MASLEKIKTHGVPRSKKWPETKRKFEKTHPKVCAVCGRKTKNQLHHKQAFHAHPELELSLSNLVWLCEGEGTGDHHLWFGHLGNFQSINEEIETDLPLWRTRISHRPLWDKIKGEWV